jgi:hypothetical protein
MKMQACKYDTERYSSVSMADAQAAMDLVKKTKRAAVVSIFQVSAGNARKVWYQLGRLFEEGAYGTASDFGPFYRGPFFSAVAACTAKERYFAMAGNEYCPSAPTNDEGVCVARPGCQYFKQGKSDSVCSDNPAQYCRQKEGSVFTAKVAGQPPGCYPVGSPCSQPPEIPSGMGQIDGSGLCRKVAASASRGGPNIPDVGSDPDSFYRALAPAGLADEAMRAASAASRDLFLLARRAAKERSCEALLAIQAFWDTEISLASSNAAGCYRILVEPAWDLAYARQSGPSAPLAFADNMIPRPEVASLLRYAQAEPGFRSWGAM